MRHAPTRVAILINNTYEADARAWKTAVSLGRAGFLVTVIARWGPGLATTEQLDHHTVTRVRQPQPLAWLPVPSLPETGEVRPGTRGAMRRRLRETMGRSAQATRYLFMSRAWARLIAEQVEPADVWQANPSSRCRSRSRCASASGVSSSTTPTTSTARPGAWPACRGHGSSSCGATNGAWPGPRTLSSP